MKRFFVAAIAAVVLCVGGIVATPTLAQVFPAVAGDVTGILGNFPIFPYGLGSAKINQDAAGHFATRHVLATGVYTWTFTSAYKSVPICTGSEEATTGHYVKITAISATAVTLTSDVTASNSDPVDLVCFGNPN